MKEWTTPEVMELEITATADDWKPQASFDGAYLGDGKFSGWFGEKESN